MQFLDAWTRDNLEYLLSLLFLQDQNFSPQSSCTFRKVEVETKDDEEARSQSHARQQ